MRVTTTAFGALQIQLPQHRKRPSFQMFILLQMFPEGFPPKLLASHIIYERYPEKRIRKRSLSDVENDYGQ